MYFLDIYIIFKTLFVVLKHSNIDTGSYLKHDGIVYKPLDVERIEKLKSSWYMFCIASKKE